MKKVTVHEPVVIAQSTTEPILHGGFQFPTVRRLGDDLLVKFSGRRDSFETHGQEDADPIYRSSDRGKTWEPVEDRSLWYQAVKPLANGDRLDRGEWTSITDLPPIPDAPEGRAYKLCGSPFYTMTIDELKPYIDIPKAIPMRRIYAGTTESVKESCPIEWKNMAVGIYEDKSFISRPFSTCEYRVDKDGTIYTMIFGMYIDDDGNFPSKHCSTHLIRSVDNGHTWEHVSAIPYKDEYNIPTAKDVEGFNEAALEILEDGSFFVLIRSGSLHPFDKGDPDHPAPKLFCSYSHDKGKTWETPKPFYDFGIRPRSAKLPDGTIVMTAGRPNVYIRVCDDPTAREWSDVINILTVPEEEIYESYYEYSCFNNYVFPYDEKTVFLTYTDFHYPTPAGERAKSIMIREITIE